MRRSANGYQVTSCERPFFLVFNVGFLAHCVSWFTLQHINNVGSLFVLAAAGSPVFLRWRTAGPSATCAFNA